MLLSGFASPRRLLFLGFVLFVVVVVFLQRSSYNEYLPKYDITSWRGGKGEEQKSSLEEDVQPPHRVESPSEDELKIPQWKEGKSSQSTSPSYAESTSDGGGGYGWRIDATTTSSEVAEISSSLATHSPHASSGSASNGSAEQAITHESYESVQMKIQELIKDWTPPPISGHWPPYDGYYNADYDPNRWEGFEWDNDFYINNGIKGLQQAANVEPEPYLPYPEYNSPDWKKANQGIYVPCEGPRGKLLNDSDADIIRAFPMVPEGFPEVAIGDANATGIDMEHCFDRYNRYGPYGYGQDSTGFVDAWQPPMEQVVWNNVKWGDLQDRCLLANRERYAASARQAVNLQPGKEKPKDADKLPTRDNAVATKPRTALLIRTWEGYDYPENDLQAIRALITELSLLSGGEYQVFLFVNVKDKKADIYNNEKVYNDILTENVPKEFQDIAILWSEQIFEEWYPEVGDVQVYWHQFMPLQWFSKTHPEFDFVWNWETDARYTGNHYHFLEAVANFSKGVPRKYMWERNQRFYFPSAHGSYEDWLLDTDQEIETGMRAGTVSPVWGPQPYVPAGQNPIGPAPPRTMKDDQFQWGVDEEADLITLQPIWDPTHTEWSFRHKIWNYVPNVRPHFTPENPLDAEFDHPEFANVPRRTYINTLSRFSKRQLHAMHLENTAGRAMQAEMWPATVALQHGLKAVYAPHPIWTDRKWPGWYMDAIFNAAEGKAAEWGQQGDSVYNHDREHNFVGWSWYYQSEFPKALYRRWLGWPNEDGSPLSHIGGPSFEEEGVEIDLPASEEKFPSVMDGAAAGENDRWSDGKKSKRDDSNTAPGDDITQLLGEQSEQGRVLPTKVGGKGRMCLPPMLLHPVKKVRESEKGKEDWESS